MEPEQSLWKQSFFDLLLINLPAGEHRCTLCNAVHCKKKKVSLCVDKTKKKGARNHNFSPPLLLKVPPVWWKSHIKQNPVLSPCGERNKNVHIFARTGVARSQPSATTPPASLTSLARASHWLMRTSVAAVNQCDAAATCFPIKAEGI